ncbi:MAG: hypothetical protein PHQ23_12025, partial [Candidatus Wallbacteria bacterium]|nr:hypothetical protein [Candidatus Wallbacteria bacterium]
MGLVLLLALSSKADVRRIEIPSGHIADEFLTSEVSYTCEVATGKWIALNGPGYYTGQNNLLETGELWFYPNYHYNRTRRHDLPFSRVIMERQTGGEWRKIPASAWLSGVGNEGSNFRIGRAPQVYAGKDILVRLWPNPLAYPGDGMVDYSTEQFFFDGDGGLRMFHSPQEIFWKSTVKDDGTFKVAYYDGPISNLFWWNNANNASRPLNDTTENMIMPLYLRKHWNELDSAANPSDDSLMFPGFSTKKYSDFLPTDTYKALTNFSYPYWASFPMKIATQNVGGITADDQWGSVGYDYAGIDDNFSVNYLHSARGVEAVPGRGYQLKPMGRDRGYPTYGMLVYIFRAPRPKGLVRWTKVSFDYASATAADK